MTQRVMIVVLEPLWPPKSGIARRLRAYVDILAPLADVIVVSCLPRGVEDGAPSDVRHTRLTRSDGRLVSIIEMAAAVLARRPLTSAFYRRRRLRTALRRVVATERPDLVVVHGVGGAALVEGLVPPERSVLDLADAEHERVAEIGRARGVRGLPYRLDAARIATWCARRLASYRCVVTVSPGDLASYRSLAPHAEIVVCPNGATLPAAVRPDPSGFQAMFLGDLEYAPNSDGLNWLVEEVLPLVPQVFLRVVGRGTAPAHPRVSHAGFVENLRPEWDAAVLLAVPLRFGGGTRIKVVEAFAAGVPVVSTEFGASGIGAEAGLHYLSAHSPAEFASEMQRLVADGALRERLASNARALVERRLTWDESLRPVVLLIGVD